ncbi:anti-sigma factor domain-containing protein [Ureibacillus composti]|nr:anti-sigma factor domain-containing protein [Ureibacillus composti]
MRTYRGIVCKKNRNDMIFMTAGGAFLRGIPLMTDPEIGDEVEFRLVATSPLHSITKKKLLLGPALVAALLAIFLVATLIPKSNSVYAYIQINGDAPIELGVDEDGNVISVHSHQKLETDQWTGQPLKTVLLEVVEKIAATNKDINITTQYEKQDNIRLNKQINQAIKDAKIEKSKKSTDENPTSVEKDEEVEIKKSFDKDENRQQPSVEQNDTENKTEKPITNQNTNTNQNTSNEKTNTYSPQQQNKQQNNPKVEHPGQSPTGREQSAQNNANNAGKSVVKPKEQSNPPQKQKNQNNNNKQSNEN